MRVLLIFSFFTLGLADPPVWYNGACGVSKYPDAGEMPLDPPSGRIVGGQDSRPNEFPWMVSITRKATGGHFCGGSIINERWILTAAHCVVGENPVLVSVVVGDHSRSSESSVRQRLDVERIFIHELYNALLLTNDVALIKLASDIDVNENVSPVCAADPDDQYEYRKSECSGWGTLRYATPCCPDILQYVTMNITTNVYCNAVNAGNRITTDMICAADNSDHLQRDSCQGDSGGPLSVKDANGIFYVIGIVSWGYQCAAGRPGVYARVGYFVPWITDKITNN